MRAFPTTRRGQHVVQLPAFRIGRFPVTNAQYLAFVLERRVLVAPEAGWRLAPVGMEPPPDKRDHPMVGITWDDAVAYCQWLSGKTGRRYRLPSEAEWEKAASWDEQGNQATEPQGTSGRQRRYPWGDEWAAGRCNLGSSGTTPVSAHPEGASFYGVEDMLGNVWEWTSTRWGVERSRPQFVYPYTAEDGRENPAADQPYREVRVLRGGSYQDRVGRVVCTTRSRAAADDRSSRRGFRVAGGDSSSTTAGWPCSVNRKR